MDPNECEHNEGKCHDDSMCEGCKYNLPLWKRPADGTIGEVVMAYFKAMAGARTNGVVDLSELMEAQDKIGFLENQIGDLVGAYEQRKEAYEDRIMKDIARIDSLERQVKEQPRALKQLVNQWEEAMVKIEAAMAQPSVLTNHKFEDGQQTALKVCLADLSALIRIWEKL